VAGYAAVYISHLIYLDLANAGRKFIIRVVWCSIPNDSGIFILIFSPIRGDGLLIKNQAGEHDEYHTQKYS
jgi:hypothetical protein